jgi:hypothetical protein
MTPRQRLNADWAFLNQVRDRLCGRVPLASGSTRFAPEAAARLRPSGNDPSRDDLHACDCARWDGGECDCRGGIRKRPELLSQRDRREIAAATWNDQRNTGGLFWSELREDMRALAEQCVQAGYVRAINYYRPFPASGTEARSVETEGLDPKDDGPTGEAGDAQT